VGRNSTKEGRRRFLKSGFEQVVQTVMEQHISGNKL